MKRDLSTCPIRPMDLGDWPAVWDLHAEHAAPLEPLWRILRMPADKPHKISGLVAYDGPHVVGYAMYHTADKRAEVLSLVVSEPRRRLGIGVRLLGRVVQAAAGKHLQDARCIVDDRNLPAQLWLRACGWRATFVVNQLIEFRRELRKPYVPHGIEWEGGCDGR